MKNSHFYFWSELELTEYYNLDVIPENTRLINSKYTNQFVEDNEYSSQAKNSVAFALGIIITLIILGGAQLYNSVKVTSVSSNTKRSQIININSEQDFNYSTIWHGTDSDSATVANVMIGDAIADSNC